MPTATALQHRAAAWHSVANVSSAKLTVDLNTSLFYVIMLSSTSAWQLYDGSIELMTDDKQGALYL